MSSTNEQDIPQAELRPRSHHESPPHLDVNAMAARGAGGKLVQQLPKLRRGGRGGIRHTQPVAQHVGLARTAQALQHGDVRRCANPQQVLLRQFVQQFGRLCGVGCRTGKCLAKRRKRGLQRRQQLRANAVAGVALVGVGGVFHPGLALQTQPAADISTGHLQQRAMPDHPCPLPAGGHGGQPGNARAARKREQQGFDLVVRMLRNCY